MLICESDHLSQGQALDLLDEDFDGGEWQGVCRSQAVDQGLGIQI